MPRQFAQRTAASDLRRKPARDTDDLLPGLAPHQLIQLQRTIGNSGVRALLAQQGPAAPRQPVVQRFWGDDEESEGGESKGGGSWLDQATETVGGWFSGDNSKSESSGGGSETEYGGGNSENGGGSDHEYGDGSSDTGGGPENESGGGDTADEDKSWWEQATDEVSSWFEDESEEEPPAGDEEKSWWDELWESDEEGTSDEAPREIEDISAECQTQNGVGHGGGKSIKLHGLTTSNYDHAKPLPAPFPSGVVVTQRKVKVSKTVEQDVFDAKGTFDVTFASNPSISLPTVPSDLTPCQEKAVQAFISGPLTAHENDHKAAFENNYDGTFTATVDVSNIKDTPEMRKRALENPVMAEDKRRADLANSESAKLDPWKETVSGLDCKEPEKKEEKAAP